MNCCRETTKVGVPPGNRPAAPRDWFRGVPERYVAEADTRGRQEGRPYPWSQQVIHEISGLDSSRGLGWLTQLAQGFRCRVSGVREKKHKN